MRVIAWLLLSGAVAAAYAPVPAGWMFTGDNPDGYVAQRDAEVRRTGTASGHLGAESETVTGFATLLQMLQSSAYAGRRVRFSAYVLTTDVRRAGLWLRVDGPSTVLAFDNMGDRPISGSHEWRQYSVVLDVPRRAVGLAFGVMLSGPGDVWIDDVRLEVVGTDVATTRPASPPGFGRHPQDSATTVARYARLPASPRNLGFEEP